MALDDKQTINLFWTAGSSELRMKVQIASKGYFELGFTHPRDPNNTLDVLIGWVPEKMKHPVIKVSS